MRRLIDSIKYNDIQKNTKKAYEEFGESLLKDIQIVENAGEDIDESLSEKIANAKKVANELKNKVTDKISDTASQAIETIKKKAGDAWEKIKDIYTTIVSFVDQTITKIKPVIKNLSDIFKRTEAEIEYMLSKIYVSIITTSTDTNFIDMIQKFPKTTQQILLINLLLLSAGALNSNFGIDISFLGDVVRALKTVRLQS